MIWLVTASALLLSPMSTSPMATNGYHKGWRNKKPVSRPVPTVEVVSKPTTGYSSPGSGSGEDRPTAYKYSD